MSSDDIFIELNNNLCMNKLQILWFDIDARMFQFVFCFNHWPFLNQLLNPWKWISYQKVRIATSPVVTMKAQVPSHEGDRDIGEKADIQMPGLLGPKEG